MEDETNNNGGMDKWCRFFQSAGADICTVIQNAIAVAVLDHPTELRRRRDEIAQRLYTPVLCQCMKCGSMTLVEPATDCSRKPSHTNSLQSNHGNGKILEGKGTSCSIEGGEGDANSISGISFDDVEALNEEIEEDNEVHQEVRGIKAILDDPDESDSQVFESLRKLELMQLTFEILKETQIGKSVNALRKARKSASIRALVKRLMEEWKNLVDEWVDAAGKVAGAAGNTSEPAEPLNVDCQNGLPSPPLDEGALITNHSTPEEIAKKSGSGEDFEDIIEASKRKLQGGYRQAEDAKRNRTVQVLALEDIPKPTSTPNYGRPGFQHHHRR